MMPLLHRVIISTLPGACWNSRGPLLSEVSNEWCKDRIHFAFQGDPRDLEHLNIKATICRDWTHIYQHQIKSADIGLQLLQDQ